MKVFEKKYSEIYDFIYKDKNYEKECDFIEQVFNKYTSKVNNILEFGCGTGGHGIILSKRGYKLTGVDQSQDMLDIAKTKIKKENLNLKLIKSEIKNLDIDKKFDAVISMFAVMGYQTSNLLFSLACKTAIKHLKKGGIFLFDVWNGFAVLNERPSICKKEIQKSDTEKIIRFTEPIIDFPQHTIEIKFKVFNMISNKITTKTNESHFMRFFFPQEIKYFLEVAGFSKIEFFPFLKLNNQFSTQNWNLSVIAIV